MAKSEIEETSDPELMLRADRLKEAVKRGGGGASIARQIGMPIQTLNNYLAGRDMKASALVSLAGATGVSIEWLATGRGPIRPSDATPGDYFDSEILDAPAHFWGLLVTLRSCQEWFHQMGIIPTLREVLGWIHDPYKKSLKLPDHPIEFKPPEEPK